ncbi:MAG: hypothetical protein ACYS0E_11735 [Planctomycetota bacterium]|jgi:hypothetical protein
MNQGWSCVLNPAVPHPVREEAWDELCVRARRPMIAYLRRCLNGFREPERIAAELLEELQIEHEGSGEGDLRLRSVVSAALERRGYGIPLDEEFDRDWTSSLLLAALEDMKGSLPRTYALLVRLYDQPDGDEEKLAAKLEEPFEEIHDQLVEGRAELQQRFMEEVRNTVPDRELAAAEAAHLLLYTRNLFS